MKKQTMTQNKTYIKLQNIILLTVVCFKVSFMQTHILSSHGYLTRWADTADWKRPGWPDVCKTKNATRKWCIREQVCHTKLAIFRVTT